MNVFHITGHLTAAPELRFTTNGTAVATLRVAHNNRRKDADGNEYPANFFTLTAWNGAENHAQHLQRGQFVEITGRLADERWEKDGEQRSRIGLVATDITYGPKPRNGTAPATAGEADEAAPDTEPF